MWPRIVGAPSGSERAVVGKRKLGFAGFDGRFLGFLLGFSGGFAFFCFFWPR